MAHHILVVEDEPLNAMLFDKILRRGGGFQVTVSENVDEILRLAREGIAHLIIMDVSLSNSNYEGMPVDGIQISKLLKEDPRTRSVPILLATAHAMRGDEERLMKESGADSYVGKPILNYQELISAVRKFLPADGVDREGPVAGKPQPGVPG